MTKDRNGEAVLAAAATLFRERGYAAASVRDIAAAAGILPGSLHYRFPSKESVLRELMHRGLERAISEVRSAASSNSDPIRALRNAIRAHLRLLLEGDDVSFVLLYDLRSLPSGDRAAIVALRDAYEGLWGGLFHAAAGAGFIRSDVDLRLARHMLLGAVNWTAQWYRPNGEMSVDDIADRFIDTVFRGVLP